MRTAIYYFSGTGNSLVVARDLARALKDAEAVPMVKALKVAPPAEPEAVGFVYPVYMFGLPLLVADFLRKVTIRPDAYLFSVATFGGLPGRPHSLAQEILSRRGLSVSCGFSVLMPGNYTPFYGAIARDKQEKMFAQKEMKVRAIAAHLAQRTKNLFEERPVWLNGALYAMLYKGGSSQIPSSAKGFWASEACTRCGLCAKVCPNDNIEMQEGRPAWHEHCEHCMACLQWCPAEAIQYQKMTRGKKRYHHPFVVAQDIMAQK